MPERRVAVDVLCHGVTREILTERVRAAAGYHVVHWSGHGRHNRLELSGEPDGITGAGLVELFADAGGFIPQLVFLSARRGPAGARELLGRFSRGRRSAH